MTTPGEMPVPRYLGFLGTMAKIVATIGILFGAVQLLTALPLFLQSGLGGAGVLVLGITTILGSLVFLGISLAFITMVQAQVETRNLVAKIVQERSG